MRELLRKMKQLLADALSCDRPYIRQMYEIRNNHQLGNCWSPHRFCGGRCSMVERCHYPEKKFCKAVDAEIEYLNARAKQSADRHKEKIAQIKNSAERKVEKLRSRE